MAFTISRGPVPTAKKVVIYGPEGIGKTSLAAHFPVPVFIDTEGSTKEYDLSRFPAPTSWQMLRDEVKEIKQNPQLCRTLVIDTADWAEALCSVHVCDSNNVKGGIEGFGYGKGYVYLKEEFGRLLNDLTDVVNAGVNVVITAHAAMRKFEQPDELGAYDRWEMKLTKQVAPLLKEWADMVLFANYKTFAVKADKSSKAKAQGGQRVMYTTHHPCWDAKNRYGLPDMLPLDYEAIRAVIEGGAAPVQQATPVQTQDPGKVQVVSQGNVMDFLGESKQQPVSQPAPNKGTEKPAEKKESPQAFPGYEVDPAIPKNLRDLMINDGIGEWDIQNLLAAWGYVDPQMPVREYTKLVNDGVSIIDGFLVPQWAEIRKAINEAKDKEEIPFN